MVETTSGVAWGEGAVESEETQGAFWGDGNVKFLIGGGASLGVKLSKLIKRVSFLV